MSNFWYGVSSDKYTDYRRPPNIGDKPYVRLPPASPPVKRNASVLRAPRPRPTAALPKRLSAAGGSGGSKVVRLAEFNPNPVSPGEIQTPAGSGDLFRNLHGEELPGDRTIVSAGRIRRSDYGTTTPFSPAGSLPFFLYFFFLFFFWTLLDHQRRRAGIRLGSDPFALVAILWSFAPYPIRQAV